MPTTIWSGTENEGSKKFNIDDKKGDSRKVMELIFYKNFDILYDIYKNLVKKISRYYLLSDDI